jgi:8-oxo-dGTP diphosphatase
MTAPLIVVAAVIQRERKILIGQRKRDAAKHALKWEFPGGKVEPGESPSQGLARELREELGVEAVIGAELEAYDFHYPGSARATRLLFFHVTEFTGEPRNLDFEQILWVPAPALPQYDFLEGDVAFVQRLASGLTAQ